jgi:hypothetical protein
VFPVGHELFFINYLKKFSISVAKVLRNKEQRLPNLRIITDWLLIIKIQGSGKGSNGCALQ